MSIDKFVIPFEQLQNSLNQSRELLPKFREIFYALKPEVDELEKQISDTEKILKNPPPVTIALLGTTGAGKSTLINKIVGLDVLPSSGSRVCTAGITRLKYLDSDEFKLTISFSSLNSWQQELKFLESLDNSVSEESEIDKELSQFAEKIQISREEKERLIAIYGITAFENFLRTRDKNILVLPANILEAFSQGVLRLSVKTAADVLEVAKKYLVTTSADNSSGDFGQVWPIVESVLIEGRFEAIKHGSEIVDLPGLNDPNPAREAKTFEYLKIAKFIFIAFESKRQPTKDIRDVLKSRDLMSSIIASGKTHAISFIATKLDSFSEEDEDFSGFSEEDSLEVLALHRKKIVKLNLQDALAEIASEMATHAESENERLLMIDAITHSKCFITSAVDFSSLSKMESGFRLKRSFPKFQNKLDTEIPALREHVDELTLKVGPEVIFRRIHSEVSAITNKMQWIMNLEFAKFVMQHEKFTEKSQALQERISGITQELQDSLNSLTEEFSSEISKKAEDFFLRIGKGVNAAPRIQREMRNFMRSLHWMTARATTSRGGRFYSSSWGYIDLASEVATPIIETVAHPWSAFFGDSIESLLESLQTYFSKYVEDFVIKVRNSVEENQIRNEIENLIGILLNSVNEISFDRINSTKNQIKTDIEKTRSGLIDLIRSSVDKQLTPVFYEASEESGTGMKLRMTDTVVEAIGKVVPIAFDTAHLKIKEVVNEFVIRIGKLIEEINRLVSKDASKVERIFHNLKNPEKPFDETQALEVQKQLKKIVNEIQDISLELESVEIFRQIETTKPMIILDGSNVATRTGADRKKLANLDLLIACRKAIQNEFPGHEIVVFVDASFKFYLEPKDQLILEELERNMEIIRTPGGVQADPYILKTALKNKARIVSGDRYRDWAAHYPLVGEPGRLIAPSYLPATQQWDFVSRD